MASVFSSRTRGVFSSENLQKVAALTGFYKRKSSFMPELFFDLLLYCSSLSDNVSLEQSVTLLWKRHRIDITKQSLDGRFNECAVSFVKEVFRQAMELELGYIYCNQLLPQFNYVRIKDSTKFNLDNRLEKHLKGSGGGNGVRKACVCIQYEYDIKSGKILDLKITPGIEPDSADAKATKCQINQRDLVIRDLGYYNTKVLWHFNESDAFFISRLNMSTDIFDVDTEEQISFEKMYKEMLKKGLSIMDSIVLVSKGEKKKFRMVVTIIPEEEYQKRMRKVNKKSKEAGYTPSEGYKARARFNIFITNIVEDVLSKEELLLLYRLRWQIELTFKTWKSICHIDKLQPMKYERFICLLMSRLILICIKLKLFWNLHNYYLNRKKKVLSPHKCFTTFQENFDLLEAILKSNQVKAEKGIRIFAKLFSKNHWKERRKNKVGYEEIIELIICNTVNYDYIETNKIKVA